MSNALLVVTTINATLKTVQELNNLLLKAQMEGRDISDEEVEALMSANDLVSAELIKKLRS